MIGVLLFYANQKKVYKIRKNVIIKANIQHISKNYAQTTNLCLCIFLYFLAHKTSVNEAKKRKGGFNMQLIETLYVSITDNMGISIIFLVGLIIVASACSSASETCTYAYHIGRSYDKQAQAFSLISLISYVLAAIMIITIAGHMINVRGSPVYQTWAMEKETNFTNSQSIKLSDIWTSPKDVQNISKTVSVNSDDIFDKLFDMVDNSFEQMKQGM